MLLKANCCGRSPGWEDIADIKDQDGGKPALTCSGAAGGGTGMGGRPVASEVRDSPQLPHVKMSHLTGPKNIAWGSGQRWGFPWKQARGPGARSLLTARRGTGGAEPRRTPTLSGLRAGEDGPALARGLPRRRRHSPQSSTGAATCGGSVPNKAQDAQVHSNLKKQHTVFKTLLRYL